MFLSPRRGRDSAPALRQPLWPRGRRACGAHRTTRGPEKRFRGNRLGRLRERKSGRYWRKVVGVISAEWGVEHAVASDDEAAIEFSQQWTSPEDGKRYTWHGAEWYRFSDGLISEIRAYYDLGRDRDTGLVDFPYAERGYTVGERASASDQS